LKTNGQSTPQEVSKSYEADQRKLEALLEKAYAAGLRDGFQKGVDVTRATFAMLKADA
jgi:hypothetical protein